MSAQLYREQGRSKSRIDVCDVLVDGRDQRGSERAQRVPRFRAARTVKEPRLFLDSGAFSAWKSGIPVTLDGYLAFLERWQERIFCYASFDVIAGKPGGVPTLAMLEEAARGSYKNLLAMRRAGFDPIAILHPQERLYWLHKMLDAGCRKIGFGLSRPAGRERWLDEIWKIVDKPEELDIIHGFGLTDIHLLKKHPQFSQVDSISWKASSYFGGLFVPRLDDSARHYHLKVSDKTGHTASAITKLGPKFLEYVQRWVTSNGFTWEQAVAEYQVRQRLNIRQAKIALSTLNSIRKLPLLYFFGCSKTEPTLDSESVGSRLVSYALLYKCKDKALEALFENY